MEKKTWWNALFGVRYSIRVAREGCDRKDMHRSEYDIDQNTSLFPLC